MKKEKKMLHRALDGETSRSETRFLRRALRTDDRTRAEFEALRKVVEASGQVRVEVSPDFTRKVLEGVRETTRRTRQT